MDRSPPQPRCHRCAQKRAPEARHRCAHGRLCEAKGKDSRTPRCPRCAAILRRQLELSQQTELLAAG